MKSYRIFFAAAIFGALAPLFCDVGSVMRKGNGLARQGKYEDAIRKYQEALVQEPDNTKIHYNLARALYKNNKFPEAEAEYQLCLLTKDRAFQAQTLYNIGNCKFKQGDLEAAIDSYRASLMLNPRDRDAKQNLEYCQKLKDQMKNQPQNDSTKQNQQPQQQQQQPQPQPKPGEISKEDADRVLQALQNREKETRKQNQERPEKEKVEKDW